MERTHRIRRTAAKKRRRHTGPGTAELCDVGTGPNSRPRSEAERPPEGVRALRACIPQVLSDWVGTVNTSRLVSPNPRRDTYVRGRRTLWEYDTF